MSAINSKSGGNAASGSGKINRSEYEYFQLYDSEDSDGDDEDADIRTMLVDTYLNTKQSAGAFCCSCLTSKCTVCLHKYFRYLHSLRMFWFFSSPI